MGKLKVGAWMGGNLLNSNFFKELLAVVSKLLCVHAQDMRERHIAAQVRGRCTCGLRRLHRWRSDARRLRVAPRGANFLFGEFDGLFEVDRGVASPEYERDAHTHEVGLLLPNERDFEDARFFSLEDDPRGFDGFQRYLFTLIIGIEFLLWVKINFSLLQFPPSACSLAPCPLIVGGKLSLSSNLRPKSPPPLHLGKGYEIHFLFLCCSWRR